jgi:hypothetical protein
MKTDKKIFTYQKKNREYYSRLPDNYKYYLMGILATFFRYRDGYGTADHTLYPRIKDEHNPVYVAQNKASCKKYNLEFSGDLYNQLAAVGQNKMFKGTDVRFWISCHGFLKNIEFHIWLWISLILFNCNENQWADLYQTEN